MGTTFAPAPNNADKGSIVLPSIISLETMKGARLINSPIPVTQGVSQ